MHHNVYDRFQGCWWGSILGQSFILPLDREDRVTSLWLQKRRKVARMLLKQSRVDDIVVTLLQSASGAVDEDNLSTQDESMLALLPTIIFGADNKIIQFQHILQNNFNIANVTENKFRQDLLIWSQLVYVVLNSKFLAATRLQINELFKVQQAQNSLISKLKLVCEGIDSGISLHQLYRKIRESNNYRETAIALSWYCFATTPRDFYLSVQRASRIESQTALLTVALTGILSGAYNGMTRISVYRRSISVRDNYQSIENDLFDKLFNYWLGVYTVENSCHSCNLEIEAIAPPRFIQTRSKLKIISQSNFGN